jgi:hypothetical protein
MSYITLYSVEDSKGKALISHLNPSYGAACFADYNFRRGTGGFGENLIHVHVLKSYGKKKDIYSSGAGANNLFSKEQIVHHLERLAKHNLPTHLQEKDDRYVITLKESEYMNRAQVRLSLDYVRMLWENYLSRVLVKYFELPEKTRKRKDYLLLLQVIQVKINNEEGYGSAHYLPCSENKVVTARQIFRYLKENFNSLKSNDGGAGSGTIFSGAKTNKSLRKYGYHLEKAERIKSLDWKDEKLVNKVWSEIFE